MGWTSTHRYKGQRHLDFFAQEGIFGEHLEVLANGVKGRAWYAAVKDTRDDTVFAAVILFRWTPKSRFNFTYKVQDETVGPCDAKAPAKVLDLLTPTTSGYALNWRANCRAYLAKPKVRKGDLVAFAEPIKFTDGSSRDRFVYSGRGNTFTSPGFGFRFSVRGWRDRAYEVEAVKEGVLV